MGDKNQIYYLRRKLPVVDGPVLEVGSSNPAGNTSSFRSLYPGEYVGVDLAPGEGVDVVADLSKPHGLPEGHFALVACCSVLEHCRNPWAMAENMTRLVRPGGAIYIAVPWTWRYHAYPDDYWRFSWSGIRELFPAITWDEPEYSTTREGEFLSARPDADNNMATVIEGRKFIPYLMLNMFGHAPGH